MNTSIFAPGDHASVLDVTEASEIKRLVVEENELCRQVLEREESETEVALLSSLFLSRRG